jgi:hypothetical protein
MDALIAAWYIVLDEAFAMARESFYDDTECYGRIIEFVTGTSEAVE